MMIVFKVTLSVGALALLPLISAVLARAARYLGRHLEEDLAELLVALVVGGR